MEARARGRETTLSRGPQDADAGQLWSGSTEEALTVSWALGHMLGTQPHRTIPAPLRGQFYRPCFTEEETEARGVYRDSPESTQLTGWWKQPGVVWLLHLGSLF